MTIALLFPGQGTQHAAMLPWLESEPVALGILASLATALGDDWRARLADDRWAQTNRVAQLLVTATSVAAWRALAAGLPRIVAVAGYSVGELAACAAAGLLDARDALALAERRAVLMDECAGGRDDGLLAVSGAAPADLDAARARWSLDVAIRIGAQQCVLGGSASALDEAALWLQARAAKATRLGVRVASHTRAMSAAVPLLASALAAFPWHPADAAWIAGSRGAVVREPVQVRAALAEQVAATVRWDEVMDTVAERRPDCVLEVGPGTTLARMWRDRHPRVPVRSCDEFRDAAQARHWVARAGQA